MLNPAILLKKGYTLTLKNGRIVTSKTSLSQGDTIETLFSDGSVWSVVDKNKNR
jgi:exodeoxyribonuclease VII large subunit